ncbi:hypothetical protein ASZ90_006899 [hydrocarbon metagenome]|uniref:Desulfoferrodoxin N-terminal domain-containing protein n=1 Tax=hydrocarbon metagenome TaxID=938273 RepID=A0A0W8FRE6_9ZZZZ
MVKARYGDVLSCEVCGLTVIVDEECGCASVDIICCEEPMVHTGVSKLKLLQTAAEPKKRAKAKKAKTVKKKAPKAKKKPVKKTSKKAAKKK